MKKLIVVIIVWVLLLAGAAYRFIQVLPYPLGGGRYSESPDERFTAYASSMTEKEFWGGQRDYYEFRIQSAGGQTIRRVVMDPPGGEMISWRGAGSIAWAADSSAVTYSFQGMDVTLKLRDDAALPSRDLQTNAVIDASAMGWSLRVASDNSTIMVSPGGKEFRVGKTDYPDMVPATLWRVPVPALNRDFLVLHVSPVASGAVRMTLFVVKPDGDGDNIVRTADVLHHYEWDRDGTTVDEIRGELFVDSDLDGIPELVDNDVGKFGGTRTYHVLIGDRFMPRWKEVFELDETTGRILRTSRDLVQN